MVTYLKNHARRNKKRKENTETYVWNPFDCRPVSPAASDSSSSLRFRDLDVIGYVPDVLHVHLFLKILFRVVREILEIEILRLAIVLVLFSQLLRVVWEFAFAAASLIRPIRLVVHDDAV